MPTDEARERAERWALANAVDMSPDLSDALAALLDEHARAELAAAAVAFDDRRYSEGRRLLDAYYHSATATIYPVQRAVVEGLRARAAKIGGGE